MKYHISIHITPYEIDDYQTFIHQLRRNLNHVDSDIVFNPCLNISEYFYDWGNSSISKDYFITKFKALNTIVQTNSVLVDEIINFDTQILGALSYKRHFIEKHKNDVDAFIWFDSDMIFPDDTIFSLTNAFEQVNHKYCIITPQLSKLWDKSWDIIVNKNYISENPNLDQLFKQYITLVDTLGHYGVDDTFITHVIDIYKQKGHDIKQFIINNLIVAENNKFKFSLYKNLIAQYPNLKTKEEFRTESEKGIITELNRIQHENIL